MRYTLEITIGFLWFDLMRAVLRSYAWDDKSFEWKEGPGWLDRTYYVKGSLSDIRTLEKRFYDWCGSVRMERE